MSDEGKQGLNNPVQNVSPLPLQYQNWKKIGMCNYCVLHKPQQSSGLMKQDMKEVNHLVQPPEKYLNTKYMFSLCDIWKSGSMKQLRPDLINLTPPQMSGIATSRIAQLGKGWNI